MQHHRRRLGVGGKVELGARASIARLWTVPPMQITAADPVGGIGMVIDELADIGQRAQRQNVDRTARRRRKVSASQTTAHRERGTQRLGQGQAAQTIAAMDHQRVDIVAQHGLRGAGDNRNIAAAEHGQQAPGIARGDAPGRYFRPRS